MEWCRPGCKDKEIHEHPIIMGWISINDRVPDTHDYVLTLDEDWESLYRFRYAVGYLDDDGKWRNACICDTHINVNYWMEIPTDFLKEK